MWTPQDFAELGTRAAIDKTLERLVAAGEIRRVARGLYDRPRHNMFTDQLTVPDYRAVIRAVARRNQARVVLDGMTAANDLGLTNCIPVRVHVLVDARIKPIRLGRWRSASRVRPRAGSTGRTARHAGRAGALLATDVLGNPEQCDRVERQIGHMLAAPCHGPLIRDDLRAGLSALPIWMQEFLRDLVGPQVRHASCALTPLGPQHSHGPSEVHNHAQRDREESSIKRVDHDA